MENQRFSSQDQERIIKSAHRLARWIADMPKYNCKTKVMNIKLVGGAGTQLIFKYLGDKDRLIAKKIVFK